MNKKVIFALLGVFLMTSGIFVLFSYVPVSPFLIAAMYYDGIFGNDNKEVKP